MKREYIIVYSTFPNLRIAKKIVNDLINKRLVACGNIFKIFSIYRWKRKIEKCPEYGVFLKTRRANYKKIEKYIINHHPYEVPEIISWPIEKGLKAYLDWIDAET